MFSYIPLEIHLEPILYFFGADLLTLFGCAECFIFSHFFCRRSQVVKRAIIYNLAWLTWLAYPKACTIKLFTTVINGFS
jgi:hypothetical protein